MSKKNEEFLKELKMKDFYLAYKNSIDELKQLREAHTILIGMIQNHHLDIGMGEHSVPLLEKTSEKYS